MRFDWLGLTLTALVFTGLHHQYFLFYDLLLLICTFSLLPTQLPFTSFRNYTLKRGFACSGAGILSAYLKFSLPLVQIGPSRSLLRLAISPCAREPCDHSLARCGQATSYLPHLLMSGEPSFLLLRRLFNKERIRRFKSLFK